MDNKHDTSETTNAERRAKKNYKFLSNSSDKRQGLVVLNHFLNWKLPTEKNIGTIGQTGPGVLFRRIPPPGSSSRWAASSMGVKESQGALFFRLGLFCFFLPLSFLVTPATDNATPPTDLGWMNQSYWLPWLLGGKSWR